MSRCGEHNNVSLALLLYVLEQRLPDDVVHAFCHFPALVQALSHRVISFALIDSAFEKSTHGVELVELDGPP